jgi:hypothetical protein
MTIVPDSKDWTWVLRDSCPECGADVGRIARGEIAGLIRRADAVWRDVLSSPAASLRARPRPGVWSVAEYGCHARDVYRVFAGRLNLIRTQDDPPFANWDQDATALEQDYASQDPAVVAPELAEAGEELAAAFEALGADEWDRTGRRSDGATFTAETLGQYLLHDVLHHLWDVGHPLPHGGS